MAAGRDDFVIAIRSAFLKKDNKQKFSLGALLLFSILLIFLSRINFKAIDYVKISVNEIVYRISFISSIPEKQFKSATIKANEHITMYNDYVVLKEKVKNLEGREYNFNFVRKENERLKKIIDEYIVNADELVAKVLIDKNSPFLKSIIINKGSKDNVKLGMAVLDGQFLIGKIVEVNYSTSRALLVSDLNSKIPVIIEPKNIQSILSGSGKEFGKIQYTKYSEEEDSFDINNVVYTSGSGGVFKSGIPIGKIIFNENNNKKIVNFFSDLSQLTFVKLKSFEKEIQ